MEYLYRQQQATTEHINNASRLASDLIFKTMMGKPDTGEILKLACGIFWNLQGYSTHFLKQPVSQGSLANTGLSLTAVNTYRKITIDCLDGKGIKPIIKQLNISGHLKPETIHSQLGLEKATYYNYLREFPRALPALVKFIDRCMNVGLREPQESDEGRLSKKQTPRRMKIVHLINQLRQNPQNAGLVYTELHVSGHLSDLEKKYGRSRHSWRSILSTKKENQKLSQGLVLFLLLHPDWEKEETST